MNVVRILVVLLVAYISATSQTPQTLVNRAQLIDYGDRFFADAYVVPTDHPDSATLAVFFRMANDFLTFTRVTDPNDVGGNYHAPMVVGIELRDTLGVIRQRIRFKGDAYTNTFEETNSKTAFHFGWQRLMVGPGTYDITLEILTTKESQQKKLRLPSVSFTPRKKSRQLTPPVFGEPTIVNGKDMLRLFVFSNNIPFGANSGRALVLLADTTEVEYDYTIVQAPSDSRDIRWWKVENTEGTVRSKRNRFPRISSVSSSDAAYLEMVDTTVPRRPIASVEIPIPTLSLVPGRYTVFLVQKGTTDTISMKFQVIWELMPFSLRSVDYAIQVLEYICTDSQMDSLTAGSAAENRERLMLWWRGQDPTPATVYNEKMAEYYRRADNARVGFSTIAEPDGARSDRGKVYMLYGQPTTTEKDLMGKAAREVWRYTSGIKQTFTFEVNESGRYKLIKVE